jgi:hypothetical protein
LYEISRYEQVLLVGRELDIVGSNDGLFLLGIIKTDRVCEVRNIKSSDMVAQSNREVCPLAIIRDLRVDSGGLFGVLAQKGEKFGGTLTAVLVLAKGIDDPNLARANSGGKGSRLGMSRDELDVLDTTSIWEVNCGDDLAVVETPETKGGGLLDAECGLEDGQRHNIVRCKHDVVFPVNAQAMGTELFAQDIESPLNILGPLVNDITFGIGLNETSR